MYRSVLKRLLEFPSCCNNFRRGSALPLRRIASGRFSTTTERNLPHPHPLFNQNPSPLQQQPLQNLVEPETQPSSASESAEKLYSYRHEKHSSRGEQRHGRSEYQDEQVRVLQATLPHVVRLGWTEAAMISGAKEVGVSPSIIGSFPRKEAAIVEFFMDECLKRLIDIIESEEDLKSLIPSDRIAKLVRIRLEMQAPFISKWPQALSIQAHPMNIPTSFKQRAMLVDEIWHASGDEASDIDWYMKRTILGGVYSATEVYMLTDNSPDFHDTWVFLNNRVKDAFDMGKTVKEATYLAEAVGAGIESTLQGFMKGMSRG